jgi:PAS domain S-box-containing protein
MERLKYPRRPYPFPSKGAPLIPISVLYVDDEPSLLEIASIYLAEIYPDLVCETAISAQIALALVQEKHFDAIVSDYQMPGMDGIELLKALREAGNTIPFIIFTGKGREDIVIQAINSGADFYIQKGGEICSQYAELVHAIKTAVERKRFAEALKSKHEQLTLIIEKIPALLSYVGSDLRCLFVNRKFAEWYGLSEEECIGKEIKELIPERVYLGLRERMAGILCDTDITYEEVSEREQGQPRYFRVSVIPHCDGRSTIGAFLIVAEDITDLKRSERIVEARVRQQAAIAELGQMALTGIDVQSLLEVAVSRVADALGVEYAKVLELAPDGRSFLLRAGVGWRPGLVGFAAVDADVRSQAGYTLLFSSPVIVQDLRTEKRFFGPPLLQDHDVVSGMSVVIGGTDRPFGILGAHTTNKRIFTEDEVHFLQGVAHILAAAAIRNRKD